jgi:hypothetical protein
MAGVLLQVQAVPGNAKKAVLTMTETGLDISGVSFSWPEIDRVRYSAVDRHINGGYMGTTFTIAVGNAAKKNMTFMLDSGTTGALKTKIDHERRDRNKAEWIKAVEILEDRVCVPLIASTVTTVLQGGSAEMGGLTLDPRGVHKGGLFSKSIAWPEVAGTEVRHPYFRVLIRAGNKTKKGLEIPQVGWNVVLLPRVIKLLSERMA